MPQVTAAEVYEKSKVKVLEWRQKWYDLEQPTKEKILKIAAVVCFILALFCIIGHVATNNKKATISRTNVVLFMEVNPEDLMALRYVLKRSDLRVMAIVLAMNAWSQNLWTQQQTIASLLSLMSSEGSVGAAQIPVYYGTHLATRNQDFDQVLDLQTGKPSTAVSCSYRRIWPPTFEAQTEMLYGVDNQLSLLFNGYSTTLSYFDAPLATLLASRSDHSVAALCLSSLTDIVAFWQNHSELRSKWSQFIASGGSFGIKASGGDVQQVYSPNKVAEYNFFFDPRAANTVLATIASSVPVVVVTYDAAVDASYTAALYQTLVTGVAATVQTANTSKGFVAAALKQKRDAVFALGNLQSADLSAPQDLVAVAIFAHAALQSAATLGSAPLSVVHDVSNSADGKVFQSTAAGTPSSTYVLGMNSALLWNHIQAVEALPYPTS
ncbi:nucleoside hydrolase, putative [Bodo saltans]|uniref:Nucleoside hydrolase, putative n=1 Tax=Bodo saltans TaxID=75058 RepID=A0A0S4JP56_BODSA|nr:nucleoside hydrolase, putative [Bodo saltans]|eukprot:CUG93335.1 nucleoside hydrolase, putative [Bodo saltans]